MQAWKSSDDVTHEVKRTDLFYQRQHSNRTSKPTMAARRPLVRQARAHPDLRCSSYLHRSRSFCRTSKMSHAGSWRAACNATKYVLSFHFENPSVARGVTDPSVGSGALLGFVFIRHLPYGFFPRSRSCEALNAFAVISARYAASFFPTSIVRLIGVRLTP